MSTTTINPSMLNQASPPDAHFLSSPPETIIGSFPFGAADMSSLPSGGKTPRQTARIHSGDNEHYPSPRRLVGGMSSMQYGSISQMFDVADVGAMSNNGSTPKAVAGAVQTPIARHIYSSPAG